MLMFQKKLKIHISLSGPPRMTADHPGSWAAGVILCQSLWGQHASSPKIPSVPSLRSSGHLCPPRAQDGERTGLWPPPHSSQSHSTTTAKSTVFLLWPWFPYVYIVLLGIFTIFFFFPPGGKKMYGEPDCNSTLSYIKNDSHSYK